MQDFSHEHHPGWGSHWCARQLWDIFQQCARLFDGKSSIHCTSCSNIFLHPIVKNYGTSTMAQHLATKVKSRHHGANCQQAIDAILPKVNLHVMYL